ncbi:hypothetical protein C4J81_11880 [Deltaproteobacteria bacterium Smac51]|nr:hypothetical protein C4J81_11880 [Deltaproteobacteria bacterium Smac51]
MFTKIKINILSALLSLAATLMSVPAVWGEGEAYFVGAGERLKSAVWQLGAFVPAASNQAYSSRSIQVDGVAGLPPTSITLTFDEPLDPWPMEIKVSFLAESGEPPIIFTMTDSRPFGGPNIKLSGAPPSEYGREEPSELFLEILERLGERLLAGWPVMEPIVWTERAEGLEAARTRLLYGARLGQGDLYLVRAEPGRYAFRPYHENNFPLSGLAAMSEWAERLEEVPAIINGGQYYPDRSYMGLLKRGGLDLSAGEHSGWKGFLVSEPMAEAPAGAPKATIIDLETRREDWLPGHYKNAMQSFMLLDRLGRIRVRNSYNLAGRAAIGRDSEGRILLLMTPAAVTLYDLAMALKNSELELVDVMGLDGGFEAQLMLRQDHGPFIAGGHFSITGKRALFLPGYSPSLPAVLAVEPLEETAEPDQQENAVQVGGDE